MAIAANTAFISYRREVGYAWAKLVWDGLSDHGVDAFLDLESMRAAGAFDTKTLHQIAARPYFLLVLTEGTLDRCVNDDDWLRLEIEHAVETDRAIVPLIIPPFSFDECDEFLSPVAAEAIRTANGVNMPPDYFDAAIERLVTDRLVAVSVPVAPMTESDERYAEEAADRARMLPAPTPPTASTSPSPPPSTSTTPLRPSSTPTRLATAERPPAHPVAPAPELPATPATPRPHRPWLIVAVAVAVVAVVAVVVVGIAALQRDDDPTPTDPIDPPEGPTAEDRLAGLLDADRATVDSIAGSNAEPSEPEAQVWVPQLSAKELGAEVDGVTFGPDEILADHLERRERYGAILVDAGAYNFRQNGEQMDGWFVTVVPERFGDADGALGWCTDQGIEFSDCFAKRISRPDDVDDSVVYSR